MHPSLWLDAIRKSILDITLTMGVTKKKPDQQTHLHASVCTYSQNRSLLFPRVKITWKLISACQRVNMQCACTSHPYSLYARYRKSYICRQHWQLQSSRSARSNCRLARTGVNHMWTVKWGVARFASIKQSIYLSKTSSWWDDSSIGGPHSCKHKNNSLQSQGKLCLHRISLFVHEIAHARETV